MSNTISLDTDLMKQLVDSCDSANESIEDAVSALAGVVSHNDWGCREKDSINEYTTTNKKKIKALQEDSRAFLKVLKQVTNDFEQAEDSIVDAATDVDAVISSVVGISWSDIDTGIVGAEIQEDTNIISKIGSIVENVIGFIDPTSIVCLTSSFLSKTMQSNISVCNFSDINL